MMSLGYLDNVEIVLGRPLRIDAAEIAHEHPKLIKPQPQGTAPVNPQP